MEGSICHCQEEKSMPDSTLRELLYGKGAHANPLDCVEGVSLELAGRRIESYPHSIAQTVAHMNYWMSYELKRIGGESPVYPARAAESWPENATPADDKAWQAEIARFAELLNELAALAASPEEILRRPIPATEKDNPKHATLHAVLWATAIHNTYHVGQIALLRRVFGSWPPRGGGDTW
jgi:uncharacterized damage-inducible protein DinB